MKEITVLELEGPAQIVCPPAGKVEVHNKSELISLLIAGSVILSKEEHSRVLRRLADGLGQTEGDTVLLHFTEDVDYEQEEKLSQEQTELTEGRGTTDGTDLHGSDGSEGSPSPQPSPPGEGAMPLADCDIKPFTPYGVQDVFTPKVTVAGCPVVALNTDHPI